MMHMDCGVHCLNSEVNLLLETLQAPQEQEAKGFHPATVASLNENWAVFLSIGVNADARRISQALTEPEYLEAWITVPDQITMPGEERELSIVASKNANGFRLDQIHSGHVIASFVASFLFCHHRKMRLTWRNAACPDPPESLLDFRIRGNFGGCILELRHLGLQSAGEFLWYQQLWSASLPRLASILRSA